MKWVQKLAKDEDGAVMVIVALALVILLGCMALVVDAGVMYVNRSNMQNVADAAALAGAQELPDKDAAEDKAIEYAALNGVVIDEDDVNPYYDDDKIEVKCSKNVPYYFARALGFENADVSARAVAQQKSQWAGEALPFVNLDDDYLVNPEIVAWEKVSPGDFESLWPDDYEILNNDDPNQCYFKVDYLDGLTITKGTVATVKQEVGYVFDQHKPDKPVYILSLKRSVINSGKVKLADGSNQSLSKLKNKDVIDVSQLVLLKCIFHDYDYSGKTLYLTYLDDYDIGNNEFPPDYVGPDGGASRLIE